MPKHGKYSQAASRRNVLKAIGASAGFASLAGCGGQGDDGGDRGSGGDGGDGSGSSSGGGTPGQELGERVPPLITSWFQNSSTGPVWQRASQVAQQNWSQLGITTELRGRQLIPSINDVFDDARTLHLLNTNLTPSTDRNDPHALLNTFRADFAGANGLPNWNNYANCELSQLILDEASEPDPERRREIVNDAYAHISSEYLAIPTISDPKLTLYYPDRINVAGEGQRGFLPANPPAMIQSEAAQGDRYVMGGKFPAFEQRNPFTMGNELPLQMWNNLVFSPLVGRDENKDLIPVLASDWETENDAQLFRFMLQDATFHNGDQVTAEDVKFTFSVYHNFAAELTKGTEFPFESSPEDSIQVVDDQTVEFHFDQTHPVFVEGEVPRYGIWSKSHIEDAGFADDIPGASFETFAGSGPFEITNLQVGQRGTLVPYDDHPVFSPGSTVDIVQYDEHTTMGSAFQAGEIDAAAWALPDQVIDLEDQMGGEFEVVEGRNIHPGNYFAQDSWGPTKFTEFRHAIGAALNRNQIVEIGSGGYSVPVAASLHIAPWHPWYPGDDQISHFTDSMDGDIELARSVLEEAGWGWDDNGNLRYPPDADLSPEWPDGETPDPADFQCLNQDGELVSN